MPTTFYELASELRNNIYELALVCRKPIGPCFAADKQYLYDTSLLRASKIIHDEASPIFYGQNCFDFTEKNFETIADFLGGIGRKNALNLRDIRIHFPSLVNTYIDDIALGTGGGFMRSIRDCCTGLRTITLTVDSVNSIIYDMCCREGSSTTIMLFDQINTLLKVISPLQKMILEVYDDYPDIIKTHLLNAGWEIKRLRIT